MAYKTKSSPLHQFNNNGLMAGIQSQMSAINAQQQQQLNSGSIATGTPGVISGIQNQISRVNNIPTATSPIVAGPGNFTNDLSRSITPRTNMNPRPQTPINPKAFSNPGTIANLYGKAMPGTFNRNMGPLAQTVDPLTGQAIDPTMDQSTAGMNPAIQGDTATPPPAGVEVPITPVYDINQ